MNESKPGYARGTVHGDVLVITVLVQELRDAKTAYALRDEMLRLVADAEVRRVVVDLQHITFMGSIGLLALLAVRRQVQGGQVVICNMAYPIRTIFELCRLISGDPAVTAPFQAEDSLKAALARLGE